MKAFFPSLTFRKFRWRASVDVSHAQRRTSGANDVRPKIACRNATCRSPAGRRRDLRKPGHLIRIVGSENRDIPAIYGCWGDHLSDILASLVVACKCTSNRFPQWRTVMTNASEALSNFQPGSDLSPLRAKWGWIVALGIVYTIVGFIALGSVMTATVASVFVVGVMMIIAGVTEVISAFQIKSWGRFLLWVVLGVLYIVAGFVTFENPLLAAALLTLILGASLVASGIIRIILAF